LTSRRADLLLLATTLLWGTTFAIVHTATARLPPLALVAMRFTIAAAVLLPVAVRQGGLDRRVLARGTGLGVLLFGGVVFQTMGLARTTPARAGFITGLYVVLVPLIGWALGQRPSRRAWVAVLVSVSGLAVLTWGCLVPGVGCSSFEQSLPERAAGDRLVFLCAFVYALHLLGVSRWAKGVPVTALNSVQLAVVAALSWVASALVEGPPPFPDAAMVWTLLYLGLACTVIPFTVMLAAQPFTTPMRASLIYSMEAVFAAAFSWLWIRETPSPSVWLGGALMLGAVLLMETGGSVSTA
jgi:drug/metabolite transporter (DMT)-like permease